MAAVLRRWWFWAGAGVVLVALVSWVVWPRSTPAPRARPYLAYTACLLTDAQGVAGADAVPVWAGMQDASLATHAKVEYLPVLGEDTVANARPYLASLLQRQCAMVIAVGTAEVGAVRADASAHPQVRFVSVGGGSGGGNVTVVPAGSGARKQVADAVTAGVRASSR